MAMMDITTTTPTKKLKPVESQHFESSPNRIDSPFPSNLVSVETEELSQFLPKKILQKHKQSNEVTEKLFTYNEVKEIVSRAIGEKEIELRAEYERVLQEKLQEQFRNFSKFNEDYISRQLKQSDFSYLS